MHARSSHFLAVSLILPLLVACGDSQAPDTGSASNSSGSSGAAGTSGGNGESSAGSGGAGAGGAGAGGNQGGVAGAGGDSGTAGQSGVAGQSGAAGDGGAAGSVGQAGGGGTGGAGSGGADAGLVVDWSRSFGAVDVQSAEQVTFDEKGAILLAGLFRGSINFGLGPISNNTGETGPAAYLARLDGDGTPLFSFGLGQAKGALCRGLASSAGTTVVVGSFGKEVDLGKGTITSKMTDGSFQNDSFVATYGETGGAQWAFSIGQSGVYAAVGAVATDSKGRIFLGGQIQGKTALGPASPDENTGRVWLTSLQQDQTVDFAVGIENSQGITVRGMAIGPDGRLVVAAELFGEASLGGDIFTAPVDKRMVVVGTFDAQGKHQWSASYADPMYDFSVNGLSVSTDGSVWVVGSATAYLPGDVYDAQGLAMRFKPGAKAPEWTRLLQGKGDQFLTSVVAHPDGGAVATGYFQEELLQAGKPLLQGAQGLDAVVLGLSVEGNARVLAHWGGPDDQVALGVALSSKKRLAFTGYYSGSVDFGAGPLTSAGEAGNSDAFLVVGSLGSP